MNMDFIARGIAQRTKDELASTDSDKGAALIGVESGGNLAQRVRGRVTPQEFGCDPADANTSDKLNEAFQYAAANDVWLDLGGHTYFVNQTIAPGGPVRVLSADAYLNFLYDGTYADVIDLDGNDTGLNVAFDIDGTFSSAIIGNLNLTGYAYPYVQNLIALTIANHADANANGRSAHRWNVAGQLYLANFDGPFYQPPESASGAQSLPYTRNHYLALDMRFCRAWDMLGKNGWDDTFAGFLRINKFYETSNLKRVDLCAGDLFIVGQNTNAAWTYSCASSGNTVTASSGHGVSVGDRLAFLGAGEGGSPLSAEVTGVSGDTLTLDANVASSVTNGAARPCSEGITGDFLNVTAGNLYVEGAFYTPPLYVWRGPAIDVRNLKISSGTFASRSGGPILCEATSGRITVALSNDSGEGETRNIVYLAKRSGSAVGVDLIMENSKANYDAFVPKLEPVVFGSSLILDTSGDASTVDSSVEVKFADQTIYYSGAVPLNASHTVTSQARGLSFSNAVKSRQFLTEDGVATVANGATGILITNAQIEWQSCQLVVVRQDTGQSARGVALVTKGASAIAVDVLSQTGITIGRDGSNNVTVTNNTGASDTFRAGMLTLAVRQSFE